MDSGRITLFHGITQRSLWVYAHEFRLTFLELDCRLTCEHNHFLFSTHKCFQILLTSERVRFLLQDSNILLVRTSIPHALSEVEKINAIPPTRTHALVLTSLKYFFYFWAKRCGRNSLWAKLAIFFP